MVSASARGPLSLVVVTLVVAWLGGQDSPAAVAQHSGRTGPRSQVFRSGVELVTVTATVTDGGGRLVTGLAQNDFLIFEDGVPQIITHFNQGRVPLSVGIALDISESMHGQRIEDAQFALNRFLLDLLDPSDEVFLVAFNHEPKLEASWTSDPRRLIHRLDDVRPFGATAIYDAMLASLPMLESRSHQRAAIVLISDGSDTASDNDVREVKTFLRRADVFVYAIAIGAGKARPIHDRINPYALREMTDHSGGYTEVVQDSLELSPATARIADELNHQYTLSYSPTHPPDGKYHSIRVRVAKPGHYVRARRGYIATRRDPHESRR